jgi:hypothetical protein
MRIQISLREEQRLFIAVCKRHLLIWRWRRSGLAAQKGRNREGAKKMGYYDGDRERGDQV